MLIHDFKKFLVPSMTNHCNRILFIHPYFGNGGAEKSLSIIAKHLKGKKIEADLFCLQIINENTYSDSFRFIYKSNVAKSVLSFRNLVECILKNNYSHVIVNQTFAITLYGAFLKIFLILSRKRTLLVSFERLSPQVFFTSCMPLAIVLKLFWRMSLNFYDINLANSREQIGNYIRLGLPKQKVFYVSNSCNFDHCPLQYSRDSKNILWLGRLEPVKRPLLAIEAVKYLPRNFKLYMVGDGSLKSMLQNILYQYNLEDSIKLVSMSDIKDLNFCCLLHTSAYEGMPNSLLESLTQGIPVVSTLFTTGLLEIYAPFWVTLANDDPSDIANSILNCISSSYSSIRDLSQHQLLIRSMYNDFNMAADFERALF